jgi:rubrerythrin
MGEELQASMWYQLRARNARISGKTEIAELYSEIARDENQHYEEMTAALKKLEKEEQYVRSEKMTVNGHSS